jgi:hypothetical protein
MNAARLSFTAGCIFVVRPGEQACVLLRQEIIDGDAALRTFFEATASSREE